MSSLSCCVSNCLRAIPILASTQQCGKFTGQIQSSYLPASWSTPNQQRPGLGLDGWTEFSRCNDGVKVLFEQVWLARNPGKTELGENWSDVLSVVSHFSCSVLLQEVLGARCWAQPSFHHRVRRRDDSLIIAPCSGPFSSLYKLIGSCLQPARLGQHSGRSQSVARSSCATEVLNKDYLQPEGV